MDAMVNGMARAQEVAGWLLWGLICLGLLCGLTLRVAEGMQAVRSWVGHRPRTRRLRPHVAALFLAGALATVTLSLPGSVAAGQGWWWGSPVNPGFDRNTVIQVAGTATQLDLPRSGPCTLQLETAGETFTVMLGPGWYVTTTRVDIRNGDRLSVEGSKMMDRQGNLHLVAARIVNQRTNAVIVLRDENGRPVWGGGAPAGSAGRLQP